MATSGWLPKWTLVPCLLALLGVIALYLVLHPGPTSSPPGDPAEAEAQHPQPPLLLGADAARPPKPPASTQPPTLPSGRVVGTVVLTGAADADARVEMVVTNELDGRSFTTLLPPGPFSIQYPWVSERSELRVLAPRHRDFLTRLPDPVTDVGTLHLVPALSYRGTVTNAAARAEWRGVRLELLDRLGTTVGGPAPLDEQGRFLVATALRSLPLDESPDGSYRDLFLLATRLRDGATVHVGARAAGFFSAHELPLEFRPGVVLEVRREDGSPCAGAQVSLRAAHLWDAPDSSPGVRRGVTDASGRYAFHWPTNAQGALVRVFEPPNAPSWGFLASGDVADGTVVPVDLVRDGSLSLEVSNPPREGLGANAALRVAVVPSSGFGFSVGGPFEGASDRWTLRFLATPSFSPSSMPRSIRWSACYLGEGRSPTLATGQATPVQVASGWEAEVMLSAGGPETPDILWLLSDARRGDWGGIESVSMVGTTAAGRTGAWNGALAWHVDLPGSSTGLQLVPVQGIPRPSTTGLTAVDLSGLAMVVRTRGGPSRRVACTLDAWEAAYDHRTPLVLASAAEPARLTVRVLTDASTPTAFAQVAVLPADGLPGEGVWQHEEFLADGAGTARVLIPDRRASYTVLARAQDGRAMGSAVLPPGATESIEVRMRPAQTFRARLALDDGREPLSPAGTLYSRPRSLWTILCTWDAATGEISSVDPVNVDLFELHVTAGSQVGGDPRSRRQYEASVRADEVHEGLITLPRRRLPGAR